MDDAGDILAARQVVGNGERVAAVLPHAQRQGFNALDEQEGVEWRHGRTKVTQQGDAHLQDVGDRPQRLGGL